MKAIYIFATALALAASPASADDYVGQYGAAGDCAAKGKSAAQCWIDIKKTGKGYTVDFVVADRMDASKVVCHQALKMRLGKIEDDVIGTTLDGLVGELGDNLVHLWSNDGGGVTITSRTRNILSVCKNKYAMNGFYEFFGDY